MFFKIDVLRNFTNFAVLESLFNKVECLSLIEKFAGPQACHFITLAASELFEILTQSIKFKVLTKVRNELNNLKPSTTI